PRAWGQLVLAAIEVLRSLVHPHARGDNDHNRLVAEIQRVHPHARGDNVGGYVERHQMTGSPPRAWGQRPVEVAQVDGVRFTPTRVGTTRRSSSPSTSGSVHPHARGDNTKRAPIRRASTAITPAIVC